ncbi:UNVERIFIED_CONTAM: hypothetical protein O8I53_10565 [Campylobacter lari]
MNLEQNKLSKYDRLIVNITVKYNGEKIKKLSRNNQVLIIGKNFYLPEISKLLLNQKLREKFIFEHQFKNTKFNHKILGSLIDQVLEIEIDVLDYVERKLLKKSVEDELKKEIEQLNKIIKVKDYELSKKMVNIPVDVKKEIEQYALQKFFEEFSKYYSIFKFTTETLINIAQAEKDNNRLKLLSNYKGTI